ncbi:MAG: hypothetical protein RL748_3163 [Pseudomonadota bacterium]|jgi:hypothetical protein
MNLLISLMIEPASMIPAGTPTGKTFLAMGGSPAPFKGCWGRGQIKLIGDVVKKWEAAAPEKVTPLHQSQRQYALSSFMAGDFDYRFDFSTGDAIDLDCFMADTETLYNMLEEACEGTDMVVSLFQSI